MLTISASITIPSDEIEISAIRAQGAGGQNVNKVSSAIHLRFNVKTSALPERLKDRILALKDHRITKDGIIVIKAQQHRTQEKNRQDALKRLADFIKEANIIEKPRRPTKPSRNAKNKRMDQKTKKGKTKVMRGKVL